MKKIIFIFFTLSLFFWAVLHLDFQRFNKAGCAFCDRAVLDSQVFFKEDGVLGVLTHKPAVRGHVLVVPKRHVERLEDLTEAEWAAIGRTIKRIEVAFGNQDYLILQKNGRGAGQSVPHVHFHYLPATKFLAVRFLVSPWLKPLKEEGLRLLREDLSELF